MSPEPHEPIERSLGDAVSAAELDAAWTQVRARRAALGRARERRRVALAVGLAATVVIGAWAARSASTSPPSASTVAGAPAPLLRRADGEAFDHVTGEQVIELDDRSRIVTSPSAQLDVLENAPDELSLHLVRGLARFEVTPGGPRDWVVEAAGVSVEVVGTVFEVDRSDASLRVRVERGVVLVRGPRVPDGVRRLVAGDELTVDIGSAADEPVSVGATSPEASTAASVPAVRGEDRSHARVEPASAPPSAAAWLSEADTLRREGREDEAIALLGRLVETHPDTPEAGIAAFTTARLMHARGREREARGWYERALALPLPEALVEDARTALAEPLGPEDEAEAPAP
ncbi:MAG: FecR domain-containing protein [Sandaracinus sp.]